MFSLSSADPGLTALAALSDTVATLDQRVEDRVRVDRIRRLEELRGVIAAAQARETAAFVASQIAAQRAGGVPAERVGRGVSAQVGLARRISPFAAARYCGQAVIMTSELPHTFTRLARGEVTEWRAVLVAQRTAWLSREHRATVDAQLAPRLHTLSTRQSVDVANQLAYRLDPHGYLRQLSHAQTQRHVSLRPAPDCMTRLTALFPVAQGVAVYAALRHHADTTVGVGVETRTRGQVMADTLVERATGQATATQVPVAVNLIMTDQTLLTHGEHPDEPAHLLGGGTIPAELARRIITDTGDSHLFLRRLYTQPTTGHLAAMDSTARLFTANQRHFLMLRDQTCRTPWCDAPIRHADHVTPADQGGPTSTVNGQGLCVACNHTKQAPGWRQHTHGDDIITTTPTGHTYRSPPPDPPGADHSAHPRREAASRSNSPPIRGPGTLVA